MAVRNRIDRFHLFRDVIDDVPTLLAKAANAKQPMRDKLVAHERHIRARGADMPEISEWRWPCRP